MRFEELTRHLGQLDSDNAQTYFQELLRACGMNDLPGDWRERARVRSDWKQSGTARENLSRVALAVPDELPAMQRRLVGWAAQGLREILGYR